MALILPKILEKVRGNIGMLINFRCDTDASIRHCSNDSKSIQKPEGSDKLASQKRNDYSVPANENETPTLYPWKRIDNDYTDIEYWNERSGVRRSKKKISFFRRINSMSDLLREIQHLNSFPTNLVDLTYYLKKKILEKQLNEQKFLPKRKAILKDDLAAAHFLLGRSGSVKFSKSSAWITPKDYSSVPCFYVPGYHVTAINAEGTNLCREGLENLSHLRHLTWLSLKGLKDIDDWCMDWITQECEQLTYLDISGCENVTHRGLSCFYRLESLKTLIVTGTSDTPEFKVACLMLQDIMPELEIMGIDLKVPDIIEAIKKEDIKELPNGQKKDNSTLQQNF